MKKLISILVAICTAVVPLCAGAADISDLDSVISDTAGFIIDSVPYPTVASIGGEWAVIGLARSGAKVPDGYFERYYENVQNYLSDRKGVLHEKKYTEYSRVILALTAIGKNPADVGGYNLLLPLGDYDRTVWQGVNSAAYALIALDSAGYEIPINKNAETQATREKYLDYIISCQHDDGGFSLSGSDVSEADTTAMVLQALAPYREDAEIENTIGKALEYLSESQQGNGGFAGWNKANSESCVQVLVALSTLGISLDDERFVKNGRNVYDSLMSYYSPGAGFLHLAEDSSENLMASEQALYALAAVKRLATGQNALYDMCDVVPRYASEGSKTFGLAGKNENVVMMPVVNSGKTFDDIAGNQYRSSIEALAARNIINGKTDRLFDPDGSMTRAEFAAITVKALGLAAEGTQIFDDVLPDDWFFGYVGAAYVYGIINGISEHEFNPDGTITREEAAVMTARAAALCGLDTKMDDAYARNILAQFEDYRTISDWAESAMAFCYAQNILPQQDLYVQPSAQAKRCEIADMLHNMLKSARLLQ